MPTFWKYTQWEPVVPFAPTHLFLCFSSPELSEAQQKLLVQSMEKKILPLQLKLVRKNGRCRGEFGKESARTSGKIQFRLMTEPSSRASVLSQELMPTSHFSPCFFLFAISQLEGEEHTSGQLSGFFNLILGEETENSDLVYS